MVSNESLAAWSRRLLHAHHDGARCRVREELPCFRRPVTYCQGAFTGEVPLAFDPGTFKYAKNCRVSAGRVTSCQGPYSGEVSVGYDPGSFKYAKNCRVANGRVMSCQGAYTGGIPVAYNPN
jgi:hypothetical protein